MITSPFPKSINSFTVSVNICVDLYLKFLFYSETSKIDKNSFIPDSSMKQIQSKIEILTSSEVEQIHQATLEVLWSVGCRLPHPRVLDRLAAHGVAVDRMTGIARLPKHFVEKVLKETCPQDYPSIPTPCLRGKFQLSPGNQANIIDYQAVSRRQGTSEDVIKGIVITNALPYMSGCMPLVTPTDCPGHIQDLFGYYLCTLYSTKPYGVYIYSPESARQIIQMWEVVKHDPSRSSFSPTIGYLLEPNGALSYDIHSLEMAIIFAEAGHQVWVGPMAMAGLDAPVTLAGTMVMQNAYNLAGIVFCWLFGLPGTWSGSAHTVDMRSLLCSFGSPNQVLIGLAAIQLGHYYGYEVVLNSGLTDACVPDFQSGFEKGMTGMVAMLAGASGIGAQGIVGADQGTSFEQLVIDNEWASAFDHIFSHGMEVTPETLAVDVIKNVGVGGSFMAQEHTARHARQTYWRSNLFNQASFDAWLENGGKDVVHQAHEKVLAILEKEYPPQPVISEQAILTLNDILERAKRQD
jgi:trimethylamine--corrinoid protein Co-methyltransferase